MVGQESLLDIDPALDAAAWAIARKLRARSLEKPQEPPRTAEVELDSLKHEDPLTVGGERICLKALEGSPLRGDPAGGRLQRPRRAHRLRCRGGADAASGERARDRPAGFAKPARPPSYSGSRATTGPWRGGRCTASAIASRRRRSGCRRPCSGASASFSTFRKPSSSTTCRMSISMAGEAAS